ncbi:MAG: hypothetical protein IT221_06180 [Fluviicola sp.]|nr:hypothetical protein [Fluviicola sp.]
MKNLLLFTVLFLCSQALLAQKKQLNLDNAVVISHLDKPEDRFSLEIALSESLASSGVKNTVSLNLLKQGGSPQLLIGDSMTRVLADKGFNTLMLVSVRGYDKKFQTSSGNFNLEEDLAAENLFPLYKEDIVSVTFEFHFYRAGQLVYTDMIKIGGASSREKVLRKLRKALVKRVNKKWK